MNEEYLKFLETIRALELEQALEIFRSEMPNAKTVLEVGAGTGWQSQKLADAGYSVEAIDLIGSEYVKHRVWDVRNYDGENIPFPDSYFDIIFSSNVLEHIPMVEEFQKEIQRVLKPDGRVLHILPSGTWRFWTTLTYFPFAVGFVLKRLFSGSKTNLLESSENLSSPVETSENSRRGLSKLLSLLLPQRHGEKGNTITEIYYFSKARWARLFKDTGWKIEKYLTNNLFYTGYLIFGPSISTEKRSKISRFAGNSCHLFLLKK